MEKEETKDKELWKATDIAKTEFEPSPQIVENLLEAGTLNIFAGAPKAGKSWLVLDLAMSVASGKDFFGEYETDPGEVLYLALEDTPRRLNNRINTISPDEHEGLDNLHVIFDCPRQDEGGKEKIVNWIQSDDVVNPKLIIIDTLYRFRPSWSLGGGYANDSASLEWLHKLCQVSGISVLLVHHDIKSQTKSWEAAVSGSRGLTGIVDGILMLKKYVTVKKEVEALFYATSRDLEETRLKLNRDPVTSKWIKSADQEFDEDALARSSNPNTMRIQEIFILSGEDKVLTTQDVVELSMMKEGTVRRILSELTKGGFLNRVQRGVYSIAPSKTLES